MQNKILNIGCGANKLTGVVNIDANQEFEPDFCIDVSMSSLPFPEEHFDEVFIFHTVEHIPREFHRHVFYEINRVLKRLGELYVSYPEFEVCAQHYVNNYKGQREFWEKTIFGRGLSKWDRHQCAMISSVFKMFLKDLGFDGFVQRPESEGEQFNTVLHCTKSYLPSTREDVISREVLGA